MAVKNSSRFRESVFTPFLRRFTDEAALDVAETVALYNEVREAHLVSVWSHPQAIERASNFIADAIGKTVELPSVLSVLRAMDRCQMEILGLETTIFRTPAVDWSVGALSLKEQVDLRRFLRAQQHFLAHDDRVSVLLATALGNVFAGLIASLPPFPAATTQAAFTVPLVSLMQKPGDIIAQIVGTLLSPELIAAGLFTTLQQQMFENTCHASGVVPGKEIRKPLTTADEADLEPMELVRTYLKGTPFIDLFLCPVPFTIPEEMRFEHTHVVGGAGHGKTQFLQHLIMADLSAPNPPALIIIDSQGDMLRKIEKLDLFNPDNPNSLSDRLIVIDPEDETSPALNIFDMGMKRLETYSRNHREQIEAGIIELYNYIFSSLAAEMTQKQGTAFAYVIRLMLRVPNATIHTLRELMEDEARDMESSPFAPYVKELDPTSQSFFRTQFFSKSFVPTKQQIARRLYGVLQVPAFDRMFSSNVNKLDMFAAMQRRNVVLINTSKALLKTEASALFGRYMIALALKAAYERVAVREEDRNAAFLIVDEAAEYFDENMDRLLSQARKYRLGVLAAHQYMDQLDPSLKSSVAANTSIKFAGGVSDKDARALAPDMRTTGDFISNMRKHKNGTQFACYARNLTDHAICAEVPFGTMEGFPRMDLDQHARLMQLNRERFGIDHTVIAIEQSAAPEVPADLEDDWRS